MDCTNIIGEKIKSLRTNQEISIQELAERAGLTVEQVSRIEENIDIPSLAPLIKIARALGVRLGTFLDDQTSEAGPVICRKGEADDTIGFSNNATHARQHMHYHSLSKSKVDRHMEPFIIDIDANDEKDFFLSAHEGEEFIMVLKGELEISYGKSNYRLKEGDTINLTVKRGGKKMDITYKSDTNVRYLLGCNFNGDDTSAMTVESVMDGMPLQEAGIQQGDVITSINGVKITNAADYQKYIQENPLTEKSVKLTYSRDGQEYDITVTPKEYRTAESGFTYNMYSEKAKGLNVVKYGAVEVKYMVRTTILSLKELVSGKLGMKDLSGPVGIVDAIGTTYEESKSEGTMILWMNMLNLAVLLSANLGVMNLLPFPALDGGRLVFLVIEAIRRKPINRQVEGGIHFAGLMLLMALMVFVMYNDIVKLI